MDKETRNAIERATQKARRLLEEEFEKQLVGDFDVLLDGKVAPRGGDHLSPRQHAVRERITASIAHRRAAGETPAEAVASYVRDAAFTTLNRFVALRMLEARGLLQECVGRGEQSSGYGEFYGLAPGLKGLPDGAGYRLYLESLFDELSTEVKVLFDRRDPASALWPRKGTFDGLLEVLNAPELSGVWAEDETIGWVYQYFNSGEERRAMRDASQAPRNSRELAVRNQFFTPRYVVRFLTENTLARIWIEMMGGADGASRIAERCDFLVGDAERRGPRAKKDPRDLKLLDPACGSGHFLLYSFDLFLPIYEEAWADPTAAACATTGRTLRDDYPDLAALRRAAPAIILEQNLHGVDIDPRCAQIAALALWLRAQRAWQNAGLPASLRPRITKTNIVVAEPMPGDVALVEEFAATLNPPLLGALFRKMVAEMRLAGELGTLLKIETLLADEIRKANAEFNRQKKATGYLPGFEPPPTQRELDFSQIDDDTFFGRAEESILSALRQFAESAAGREGVQKRLFADDATQGIAVVDIARARYDVVLMNPPFGKASEKAKLYFDSRYSNFKTDIGLAFVNRMLDLSAIGGLVGAITSRNFLAVDTLKWFREHTIVSKAPPAVLLDLGYGVLDAAMVEAAAYVLEPGRRETSIFLRALESREKEAAVVGYFCSGGARRDVSRWDHSISDFASVPLNVLCYWLPKSTLAKIISLPALAETGAAARHGMQTTDDFRFLRLRWEVEGNDQRRWVAIAKGGEYQPYWEDLTLVVDWGRDGALLKTYLADKRLRLQGSADWTPWLNHCEYYFQEGLTYPERTTSDFSPRILPSGAAFSGTGIAIQFPRRESALAYLGGSYTRVFKLVTESFVGSGDNAFSGSAAKRYRSGLLNQIPAPLVEAEPTLLAAVLESASFYWKVAALAETSATFGGTYAMPGATLCEAVKAVARWRLNGYSEVLKTNLALEKAVSEYYGLDAADMVLLDDFVGPHPELYGPLPASREDEAVSLYASDAEQLMARAVNELGARRQLTKKSYVAERQLELVAHVMKSRASELARRLAQWSVATDRDLEQASHDEVSYALGVGFGRWRASSVPDLERELSVEELFSPPTSAASANRGASRILVDDAGHANDVIAAVRCALDERWGPSSESVFAEIEKAICRGGELRSWLASGFFEVHARRYQDARRTAPIYWQLATPSASYSVWLYAHSLTHDTFFHILHDVVAPKVSLEERKLLSRTQEFGPNPTASQRKEIAAQEGFVDELRSFRDEVARIAPLWKPDLDDGVLLTMAPLWRLVPQHRAWQKELKAAWESLCEGDYDWAHVAMHLWPERVVPKCAKDRSLAIAHDLEDVFWEEDAKGKWVARPEPLRPVEELVRERTSPAVKAALKYLLEAPVAGAAAKGAGRGRKRKG